MNILVCYGTRPELIKIKPVLNAFKINNMLFETLRVEQHTTLITGTEQDDYIVRVPSGFNRLDALLATANNIPDNVFRYITHVLVQGDTSTAFVCAMAAFHRNIPVIHLEAGLRTYDTQNPYPEETYRQLISRVASIHLCPTNENKRNLLNEGINKNVFVVGNTVVDNLVDYRSKVVRGNEIVITLHRRENHSLIKEWFLELDKLAHKHPTYKFVLPIHPNPNVQKHRYLLKNVEVIDPLPYESFLEKLVRCAMIVSDSGGIQEEASFLGKKLIVCRETTERPESLNQTSFLCTNPKDLEALFDRLIVDLNCEQSDVYGNGFSAKNIVEVLRKVKDGN